MEKGWGKMLQPKPHRFGMPQKSPTPTQELQSFGTRLRAQTPPFVPKGHPSTAQPRQEQEDLWLGFSTSPRAVNLPRQTQRGELMEPHPLTSSGIQEC